MRLTFKTLALPALLLAAACSRQAPMEMTPEVAERTPGRFVWYDLITDDIDAASAFYGDLFGWEFEDVPEHPGEFQLIRHNGVAIGGMVYHARDHADSAETQWIGSLSVTNVDSAVAVVRAQGGTVYAGPKDVPLRGRVAVVADPQGAVLALVRTPDGDPAERQPAIDDWLWQELWTTEDSTSLLFYRDMAGFDHETLELPAGAYHVLKYQGRAYAGLAQLPWDSVPPVWLPYVRVEDPQAIADRVEELGGRVILSPDQIQSREAAVIEDPTGGALAVQRWVPQDQAGGE